MSIVDIIVLVILITFAIIGFKRGVLQSLIACIGFIIVIYAAYLLKNYLGDIFVLNLPFIDFKIGYNTSVVMNVIMYQTIAFVIMVIIFGLVYKFLLALSGIIEKLLKITIILGIPSKILGLIVGLLEGYIIVYLALFFVAQPYIKMDILNESKYAQTILTKTPILSGFANNTLDIITEINDTITSDKDDNFDLKLSDLILKNKVVNPSVMKKLVDSKKIKVNGIEEVINKYENNEEGEND